MNAAPPFAPLRNPPGWPPPDPPPPGPWEVRLRGMPFPGRTLARQLTGARWNRHARVTLLPVGRAIGSQLEPRPATGPWPADPLAARVAGVISRTVRQEKWDLCGERYRGAAGRREGPALHPEDPMPLLLWGPFDDATPLILFGKFEDPPFGIPRDRTREAVERAWLEAWTCRRFVEHVAELCREHTNRDRQGVGSGDPRAVRERCEPRGPSPSRSRFV